MNTSNLLSLIDAEIAVLKQTRALLSTDAPAKPTRGRPKGSTNAPAKKKRNLSPEGRKRIIEGVKRRWAAKKKAAGK